MLAIRPERRVSDRFRYTYAVTLMFLWHYLCCVLIGARCRLREFEETTEGKPPAKPFPSGDYEAWAHVRADIEGALAVLYGPDAVAVILNPDATRAAVQALPPEARAVWVIVAMGPPLPTLSHERAQEVLDDDLRRLSREQPDAPNVVAFRRHHAHKLTWREACFMARMDHRRIRRLQRHGIRRLAALLTVGM